MSSSSLQELCALGQEQLMQMQYLRAEATLVEAEKLAMAQASFDTLARLYMPLQESRRQRRQRCGEGVVCLDLIAQGPDDHVDGQRIVENFAHGQLLVAGWGSIEPALKVRKLQAEHELYVETFLAAVYPVQKGRVVVIVPLSSVKLPSAVERSRAELMKALPEHCIVIELAELPQGSQRGDSQTFARVMSMWERLHLPFLSNADSLSDPTEKLKGYRRTIEVDYACELAHQKLSDVARHQRTTRPGSSLPGRDPR